MGINFELLDDYNIVKCKINIKTVQNIYLYIMLH